jgi:hypothetical protein
VAEERAVVLALEVERELDAVTHAARVGAEIEIPVLTSPFWKNTAVAQRRLEGQLHAHAP